MNPSGRGAQGGHGWGIRLRALLSLGGVVGLGAIGTLAAWNDTATATSGTFRTGTIDLRLDGSKSLAFGSLAMTTMLPGESVAARITVQNRGSIPLTYTMSAATPAAGAALSTHLQIEIYPGGTAGNTVASGMRTGSCTGTRLVQATPVAGSSVPVVTSPRPVTATTGTDPLCIVVRLAPTAPMTAQNLTVSGIVLNATATAGQS